MKRRIKLIGLDLDGTVFNDRKEITAKTIDTLKRAFDQGVVVAPVTGRPVSGVPEVLLREIPQIEYILAANGAVIKNIKTNKIIYQEGIPCSRSLELVDRLRQDDIMIEPYIDGEAFSDELDLQNILHFVKDKIFAEYFIKNRKSVKNIRNFIREQNSPVEKIHLIFADLETRSKTKNWLIGEKDLAVTSANGFNLELNKSTVNKGYSLLALAKLLGISKEEVMACGDNGNDMEMVSMAGFGVAMGNAIQELKEAADYVTLSNNEDGVAYAIEKFVLQ